jgi:ketosteroid isomerase-like protein
MTKGAVRDLLEPRDVVRAYHAAIDRGQAASALPMFTEDAYVEARDAVLRGQEEIGRFLRDRQAQTDRHTAHLITAEFVEHASDTEVETSAFVLVFVRGPQGEYAVDRVLDTRHVLRRTADGWRIARRYSHALHAGQTRNIEEG